MRLRVIVALTIVAVALALPMTGCTAYRPAVLPAEPSHLDQESDAHVVAPRADVRITLTSGETIEGEVLRCTSDEIILGRPGNYGLEEEAYPAASIAQIEVAKLTSGGRTGAAVFVTVAVLVLIGLAGLSGGF